MAAANKFASIKLEGGFVDVMLDSSGMTIFPALILMNVLTCL